MAAAPWRCSQCGTINEPVANSCRTCGKWPSLFDLEDNVVDETELEGLEEVRAEPAVATLEPERGQAPVFEPPPPAVPVSQHLEPEPEPFDGVEAEDDAPKRRWTSAIIPVAVLVYFVVRAIVEAS